MATMHRERRILAYGVTEIDAVLPTRIVTAAQDDVSRARSILIISDDGSATNGNTVMVHIGDENITVNGPGIRPGAGWSSGEVYPGPVWVSQIYGIASLAGQKVMWWVLG